MYDPRIPYPAFQDDIFFSLAMLLPCASLVSLI
jgi:hypothetical protein